MSAPRWLPPAALLALMGALLVLGGLHKQLKYDEMDNMHYGMRFVRDGPDAIPWGQRMPALVPSALSCLHRQCRLVWVNRGEMRRLLVRAPTIAVTLLLGGLVYAWGRELFGRGGALTALTLFVFNPSFLAHGKQVTTDAHAALFTTAAIWLLWRLRRAPTRRVFLACAAATAAAVVSKITSALLFPLLAGLAVVGLDEPRPLARRIPRVVAGGALLVLVVLLLVNAVYGFRGTFRPAREFDWLSRTFEPLRRVDLPVFLPRMFLWTLDRSAVVQEDPTAGRGANYALGELYRGGRWYAFPLMLLLKTPLALFVLLAWSAAGGGAPFWGSREALFLWLPALTWLAFFSLLVEPQIGVRYLLPAMPFLILAAARPAAPAPPGRRRWALFVLLAWYAGSSLSYHPHYMSYFNELIGRRLNAYRYLADSNLDWEDRGHDIARFAEEHPEMELVIEPLEPTAGHILVGANKLVGIYEPERYRWLRENFEPAGHVGYSYLLFEVTPERLEEVLKRGREAKPPS